MKILHLISQHPESTGSGFYLQNVIRQAALAGQQNFLVAGISDGIVPELFGITAKNCKFVRFGQGELDFPIPGMSNVMPYPSSRFAALTEEQIASYEKAFAEALHSAVRAFSPDILHSHHLWLVSALARRLLPDIPMVTSCHSTDLRQFVQCPHLREKVRQPCLEIDRVLALSYNQAEKIGEIFAISNERIDVVGGGYDQELFYPVEKSHTPPIHLLYAGKISLAKGVDWLLRTFAALENRRLHLHLAGSGSGEEAQLCLSLAEKVGDRVTVHGWINQQELARLMAFCHIFILPSFYEGLPLVLLEALAAGCRIIATDLPGCRELLANAGPDLVRFVKLPALSTIDRPDQGDWDVLQVRLAAAITDMAGRVALAPSPAPAEISEITSAFSWQAVFARIVVSYEKAMAA
jgi:glycosyltransferase involved in cell wall biosynthesis